MKTTRLSLVALLLFAFAHAALSQAPAPKPVPEQDPKNWKEFTYTADNVKFRLPAEPKLTDATRPNDKVTEHNYMLESFVVFTVSVLTAPGDFASVGKPADILQGIYEANLAGVKDKKPVVLADNKEVTVDGSPARFYVIETSDNVVTRIKTFIVKNRVYIGVAAVDKGQRPGVNAENNYEVPAMAFLDSVRPIAN
jgi:hypothetical protein